MAPKVKMDNMSFTDQRNFIKTLAEVIYSPLDIERGYSVSNAGGITKSNLKKALKRSGYSQTQKDRILSDFSIDYLINVTRNQITNIKNLVKNGKLDKNIQTLDNERGTPEYEEFNLSNLEKILLDKFPRFNKNARDIINNYNPTDKEIVDNFINHLEPNDIKDYFNSLKDSLFKSHIIKTQEHDYNIKTKTKEFNTEKKLDKIGNKISDKKLYNDANKKYDTFLFREETKKENLIEYVTKLKEMNDLVSNKPWYVRWFSISYRKQMNRLDDAKVELYKRGVSKDSLEQFLKSDGLDNSINEFYNSNEAKIKEVNTRNKNRLDEIVSKQEDIDINNFFKEQELSKKAQETLDKANSYLSKDEGRKKEALKEKKEETELYIKKLKSNLKDREHTEERTKEYLRHIEKKENKLKDINDKLNNLEKPKEDSFDDILNFDPSKDIMDSSDNLVSKLDKDFDNDFIKDTLDAFEDKDLDIVNEKEI